MSTVYEFTHVKSDSADNTGVLDVHNKEGKITLPPSQFTLDFWIKCKFNPLGTEKKEIFGMYLYDDEDENASIYDSSLADGQEVKLDDVSGITSYINIYVDPNRNNDYIFNINKKELKIDRHRIDNEWNHIALVYDKLNNTSCIWYLNGNPILGVNISNPIMQEIINKKFCRFLWTMYKNEDYLYLYKVNIIENSEAGLNNGIKYNKAFNPFDRKYIDKNDNIDTIINAYNGLEIKPTPSHTNYENLIYLPMQHSVTEDLGNGGFNWIDDPNQYSKRVEYDIADIIINDEYSRISEIVNLKNFKCDDRDPISLYLYDDDYRIDLGNAAALHAYSRLYSKNLINLADLKDGFTIDWFAPYINTSKSIRMPRSTSINDAYNEYKNNRTDNVWNSDATGNLYSYSLCYPNSSYTSNWKNRNIFRSNDGWSCNFNFTYKIGSSDNVYNFRDTIKNIAPVPSIEDIFRCNMDLEGTVGYINEAIIRNKKYLFNLLNTYNYNYNMYNPNLAEYNIFHYTLVFKPGGKILYFINGNKIDRNYHSVTFLNNDNFRFVFNAGIDDIFYPNLGNISDPFYYLNQSITTVTEEEQKALNETFEFVKKHRYLALNTYKNLNNCNGVSNTNIKSKFIQEGNNSWIKNYINYYNHFTFKSPIIFNHFRVTPDTLWYDDSFDPLTDTRLFNQEYDDIKNSKSQIISDIEEDSIALLYPVNNPKTIYDRRYSKSANARKDSRIQKSNFQVELLSTDPGYLQYNSTITSTGDHKPNKYSSYPAIVTNTYRDNDNVIIFRNHHIENKSWTVNLWVYPLLQTEVHTENNMINLIYLSGFGLNGNQESDKFRWTNGMIGLRLFSYGTLLVMRNNSSTPTSPAWSLKNQKIYNMLGNLATNNNTYYYSPYEAERVISDIKINFNDWNHIAIVSDIEQYKVYMYINGIKAHMEENRFFSNLHRIFLYTGTTDNWVVPYYTGLKVIVGEAMYPYTENSIDGWEDC